MYSFMLYDDDNSASGLQNAGYFSKLFFPKLNISKVRFSLHSTMDTCDIQIGIPIYQKLISESVV